DLSGLGLMVPALPRDCDVPGFMFPPFPCSTVPDDALPLGSGTSDSPVRSDCDPPLGPVASGLIFSGAGANTTPVLIQAATNTDPVTANGLRFIMPPFSVDILIKGQTLCHGIDEPSADLPMRLFLQVGS